MRSDSGPPDRVLRVATPTLPDVHLPEKHTTGANGQKEDAPYFSFDRQAVIGINSCHGFDSDFKLT